MVRGRILTTHLACIAAFGGMIVITDLRLLGWAMQSRPIADVIDQLRVWKRIGFVIMATCGILLAGSKAVDYYPNPYFWTKLSLLALVGVHALIFRPGVYNGAKELDLAPVIPTRAKVAGALSLVLWTSVLCAGRLIGYYELPVQKGHVAAADRIPSPLEAWSTGGLTEAKTASTLAARLPNASGRRRRIDTFWAGRSPLNFVRTRCVSLRWTSAVPTRSNRFLARARARLSRYT